jgi:hypothetical protein
MLKAQKVFLAPKFQRSLYFKNILYFEALNACLSSISLYMLSFLEAPKGFIKKADLHRIEWFGMKQMARKGIIW